MISHRFSFRHDRLVDTAAVAVTTAAAAAVAAAAVDADVAVGAECVFTPNLLLTYLCCLGESWILVS